MSREQENSAESLNALSLILKSKTLHGFFSMSLR